MLTHDETLHLGHEQLLESMRKIGEWVLAQSDDRLPQLLTALGSLAAAASEFETVSGITKDIEQVNGEYELRPVMEVSKVAKDDAAESQTVADIILAKDETIQQYADIFDIIPESTHAALSQLLGNPNQRYAPRDLLEQINAPNLPVARQRLNRMFASLESSRLAGRINAVGKTKSRRYYFDGENANLEPSVVIETTSTPQGGIRAAFAPKPTDMPPRLPVAVDVDVAFEKHSEQVVTLTNWGLEYCKNGNHSIRVNGMPIRTRPITALSMLIISQYEDGVSFHKLRKTLIDSGHPVEPNVLLGIVSEIKHALGDKADRKWVDSVHATDGEDERVLALVGAKPSGDILDFLVL